MATSRLCSIPNCGKPVHGHGFCGAHDRRLGRHGDPLGGGTANGEPARFYREVVLHHEGLDCLVWPFNRNSAGYGMMWIDRAGVLVSRRVCEEVNGQPPTPEHEAAHSCGQGHLGCVTKRHVSWKTTAANHEDKLGHGTHNRGERHPMARLAADEIRQIRALRGHVSQSRIASKFGVTQSLVSAIQRRARWGWLE